jgi:RNA polymerase sigma-70 factor (ECF subfamily)
MASYDAAHALGAWARVIALRLMLDKVPRRAPERTLEGAVLDSLHAIDGDPELLAQRSGDARLVRGVIEAACRALDARSRRMLRHSLVEARTVDEIGALYGVHRATAARQVRRALELLVASARAALGGTDAATPVALSRVDLSLERWLESTIQHARSA